MAKTTDRTRGRQKPLHRSSLSPKNKRVMFAILIQNDAAFKQVSRQLTEDKFAPEDAMYTLLWRVVCKHYEQMGSLPELEIVKAEVSEALRTYGDELAPGDATDLRKFLDWAYASNRFPQESVQTGPRYAKWAINKVRQYMEEYLQEKMRSVLPDTAGVSIADVPEVMRDMYMEAAQIRSLVGATSSQQFPDEYCERDEEIPRIPMQISCFTKFMGGMAPGEVYGLMGPFGSCKTTLIYQLAVDMCRQFASDVKSKKVNTKPLVFVASYEAPVQEMRDRAMGYAAAIHRDTMERIKSIKTDLSRRGNLRDYEKERYKDAIGRGQQVVGEYERFMQARRVLEEHIVFWDMTGSDPNMLGEGTGGIVELSNKVAAHLRANPGTSCGILLIDYAKAMALRLMGPENLGDDKLRHILGSMPLTLKHEIGLPYQCPVWIAQQVSADANTRRPGSRMHHTDAAECRTFGENCDFCFCLGAQTDEQILAIWCSKHRRTKPERPALLRVEGDFYRTAPADRQWTLDMGLKRIVRTGGDDAPMLESESTRAQSDNSADI